MTGIRFNAVLEHATAFIRCRCVNPRNLFRFAHKLLAAMRTCAEYAQLDVLKKLRRVKWVEHYKQNMSQTVRDNEPPGGSRYLGVFRYSRKAIALVWTTSPKLTTVLAFLTVLAGVLPAGVAYVGQLIVDSVVHAIGNPEDYTPVIRFVIIEAVIVATLAGAQRAINLC